ncbi:MAG: CHAT domain-containing protein [Terracidiphilus sp.]
MTDDLNPSQRANPETGKSRDGFVPSLEDLFALGSSGAETRPTDRPGFSLKGAGPCPEPGEWLRLARGETLAGETEALLSHAAMCAACVTRLRQGQRVLSQVASPEESEELGQFASASPQWRHRFAVELAHTPHLGARKKTQWFLVWASTGAATALILISGFVVWWRYENAPARLLAEAYTHSRIFDLRIPGAGFAAVTPETHLRGGSADREPAQLLTARAEIQRKLEAAPADPHWLQLEARADLIEEKYDPAIDILDRLLAAGPVTPELLTDDASAYFQRGTATGSENDRATALDYLRRADELAPGDPVVLFNEAVVMEDRGQVMNAVETWNRYLNFEHDPRWQQEGRERLKALEEKLNRLKSHQSRMQQRLATPQAMRALAADPTALAGIDEELSSTMLPHLLDSAFPLPVDRSRGSPCEARCQAAQTLLRSLAASLQNNHQDPWLAEFLPPALSSPSDDYLCASHALSRAIHENTQGDYSSAERWAVESSLLFHRLNIPAGEDRAEMERVYAMGRAFTLDACHQADKKLMASSARFPWIKTNATIEDVTCDLDPGDAAANNPLIQAGLHLAETHHYTLLDLRARNALGEAAVESGDIETGWRINIESLRRFYAGDYPPFRAATILAGIAYIEDATPRVQLDLLINRETFQLFSLAQNRTDLAAQRFALIRAAIRAGSLREADEQMAIAKKEITLAPGQKGLKASQAESEIAMSELYLDRRDLKDAGRMLDDANNHMIGEDNPLQLRRYATALGELELALGHPESAESTLRAAVLKEELQARGAGTENVVYAREDRELYAALAGVWLAQKRPGDEILALWERYRLRILGKPVPACRKNQLDCLKPQLQRALDRELVGNDQDRLMGQVVLRDRVLRYRADAHHVEWTQVHFQMADLLAAAASLERVADSPSTSLASVDQAARRLGDVLMGGLRAPSAPNGLLVLEPDPLLGNVPWPSVEIADGPIGLRFNLEESPSVLLDDRRANRGEPHGLVGRPLVVGASVGAGESQLLPEVLNEARTVARLGAGSNLLLADQATETRVVAHLASASIIHFAGHAAEHNGATRLLLAPSGAVGDHPYLDRTLFLRDPPTAARLVVFSACSSGKNEEGWNHGMGDIVDTLASLGVPEVVATRWQIDSASAVPMMDSFYRGLAGGLSVPQALTAARQSLFRDARYRHPYYWAAYYASGVGNPDLHEVFHDSSK